VAQLIHTLSPRFTKPFIEVNCAAIPEELIESELFGHEKGAFTGATQLRRGKFDLAHGGTLFLDEIGDMSLKTQAKILRILQEQKFERVGGGQSLVVDVRIVAATNKDLRAEIAAGNFREDLFYRLNVIPFQLPPLRERKEDIVPLAEHFLAELVSVHGRKPRSFAEDACAALRAWGWPGNVRELRNLVERLVILTPEAEEGTPIQAATLIKHLKDAGMSEEVIAGLGALDAVSASVQAGSGLKGAKSEFEREFILKTLRENEWNISKTAQILGIERSYLHRKMKAYGIESDG
jgi:two-component system nitrogen regulation response regulator NtrX